MPGRFRPFSMLVSGLTTVGLIAMSPDALPPAAAAGLIIISFALIVTGLRRAGGSVSA